MKTSQSEILSKFNYDSASEIEAFDIEDFKKAENKRDWIVEALSEGNSTYAKAGGQHRAIRLGRLLINVSVEYESDPSDPNDWGGDQVYLLTKNSSKLQEGLEALGVNKDGDIRDGGLDDCACELARETPLFKAFKERLSWCSDAKLDQLYMDLSGGYMLDNEWRGWDDGATDYLTLVDCILEFAGKDGPELPLCPDRDDEDACSDFIVDSLVVWHKAIDSVAAYTRRWKEKRERGEYGTKYATTFGVTIHSGTYLHEIGGGHPLCPWDSSPSGGVWVPSKDTIAEIDAVEDPEARQKLRIERANQDIRQMNRVMNGGVYCMSMLVEVLSEFEGHVMETIVDDSIGDSHHDSQEEAFTSSYIEGWVDQLIGQIESYEESGDSFFNPKPLPLS